MSKTISANSWFGHRLFHRSTNSKWCRYCCWLLRKSHRWMLELLSYFWCSCCLSFHQIDFIFVLCIVFGILQGLLIFHLRSNQQVIQFCHPLICLFEWFSKLLWRWFLAGTIAIYKIFWASNSKYRNRPEKSDLVLFRVFAACSIFSME